MSIKEKILSLFESSATDSERALETICEAEKYLQQAYEGRYFFELIQNIRDANKEASQEGDIYIELKNNILSIANTDAPFSDEGITSITSIGQSTKRSLDFIGFKGIGFKSTLEVSETPRIITREGAIYFDRKLTAEVLQERGKLLTEDQVPLFFFPHYQARKLTIEEIKLGIVTRIELPVKKTFSEKKIYEDFNKIEVRQLILLGNIRRIKFLAQNYQILYNIQKDHKRNLLEIDNGTKILNRFRYYIPDEKIVIPNHILGNLTGKEKEIYSKGTAVDIHIVFELNEKKQFIPIDNAKLYLFYPLHIRSGFQFIIHSYFLVNPERTQLRNSPLNLYLLRKIGEYIGNDMLRSLKSKRYNTNEILRFERNKDTDLDELYNGLVETLESQKFIYNPISRKYHAPSEVIIADGFDKGLFPDNLFNNKPILYIGDQKTVEWLKKEFDVYYLNYDEIANNIEDECKKQVKRKNLAFFENLYRYIDTHGDLHIRGKKILLTNNWKLISDREDVFYGGRRNPIKFPITMQRHIHFIHHEIKLEIRETRIGVIEFNTHELTRKLLKLFDEKNVPKADILNTIYRLCPTDTRSELEIKEKILLPIKNRKNWISPIDNPIYFETDELKELYPDGNFVDEAILKKENEKEAYSILDFFRLCGVWEIPAFYIKRTQTTIHSANIRMKHIRRNTHLNDSPFYIDNDRMLHKPVKYTKWFTETILINWELYKSLIASDFLPKLKYSNSFSNQHIANVTQIMQFSSFCEDLANEQWIVLNDGAQGYSCDEIVGCRISDISKANNKVMQKYLTLYPLDYDNYRDFINSVGLLHFDCNNTDNFNRLLNHVYEKYEVEIPQNRDFIDFYNRILGKIIDFCDRNEFKQLDLKKLCNEYMLSVNETTGQPCWMKPEMIYYIDDKSNYDRLPEIIKAEIQPHFTNRDRNTFGKIAAKIGNRFSKSITKKLIEAPEVRKVVLIDFFTELPQIIALLEYTFDIALSSHLETLKSVEVYIKQQIQIEIQVNGYHGIIVESDYYIQKTQKSYIIHITEKNEPSQMKFKADSLAELLINILDRDLKRFNIDILNFLRATKKIEYLKDYDIDENRIDEIRQILYASDLTFKQKFWQAVFTIKKIPRFDEMLEDETIDSKKIALATEQNTEIIQTINREVSFDDINYSRNIPLLASLLSNLEILPDQLNHYIYPEIDFTPYYQCLLDREKNKFESKFAFILYRLLCKQSIAEQSVYQEWINKYNNHFCPLSPPNIIQLNIHTYFIKYLNEFCPLFNFTIADMNERVLSNSKSIYKKNLDRFTLLLTETSYSEEEFKLFFEDEKRQSLLYFGKIQYLIKEIKKWLSQQRKKDANKTSQLLPEQVAIKYANQRKPPVEHITPNRAPERVQQNQKTVANYGMNKYDGQKSNQQKQTIGMVAEMIVYETLCEDENIETIKWISKYAARIDSTYPGYNSYGTDGLGYDIEYTDKEGNKYYVEVKGKSDNTNCFEITDQELKKAQNEKEYYQVFFVTNVLHESARRIKNLGNPFIFKEGENLFNNKRFLIITKSYEIRFIE